MSHSYNDLLSAGPDGDKVVTLKLKARQIAIAQLLIESALDYGLGVLVIQAVANELGAEQANRIRLEFDISQNRIGIAMCRLLGDTDYAAELTANLARLDGEAAELS